MVVDLPSVPDASAVEYDSFDSVPNAQIDVDSDSHSVAHVDTVPSESPIDYIDPVEQPASRQPSTGTITAEPFLPSLDLPDATASTPTSPLAAPSPVITDSLPTIPLGDTLDDLVDDAMLDASVEVDNDEFVDAQEDLSPQEDDLPDSEFNFDIDVDDAEDSNEDIDHFQVPLVPSTAVSPSPTDSTPSKVQSRTLSQEGGNVVENNDLKHKQPIEVEYNLPFMYNPNKKRFKPQLLNKRRKKTRLNLICTKRLPFGKSQTRL
ncbi:hypothetical protein EDC96DRAFT_550238 [Choanephora cucurbitarum]|nr:hypothetical protein EDC96DRAFT_550238 [Choanephora cucurbitarum]